MCRPKAGDPPPDKHSVLCRSLCETASVSSATSLLSLSFPPEHIVTNQPAIGFIGFGEAGFTVGNGLRSAGVERLFAYDIATDAPDRGPQIRERAGAAGATLVADSAQLAGACDV